MSGARGPGPCAQEFDAHGGEHIEGGEAWALYEKVDTARLVCLNEERRDSLKDVLRPWHERLNPSLPTLDSDTDEQLLMCIPFVASVKIKSICVIGGGDEENPARMSAFINREVMDFSTAENTRPVQEWQLSRHNIDGRVEYPTRISKFQNVNKLWLFIPKNFGAEKTSIVYIGLKGEFTRHRREVLPTLGEAKQVKTSEDVRAMPKMPHQIS